jgi:hypothetical protein
VRERLDAAAAHVQVVEEMIGDHARQLEDVEARHLAEICTLKENARRAVDTGVEDLLQKAMDTANSRPDNSALEKIHGEFVEDTERKLGEIHARHAAEVRTLGEQLEVAQLEARQLEVAGLADQVPDRVMHTTSLSDNNSNEVLTAGPAEQSGPLHVVHALPEADGAALAAAEAEAVALKAHQATLIERLLASEVEVDRLGGRLNESLEVRRSSRSESADSERLMLASEARAAAAEASLRESLLEVGALEARLESADLERAGLDVLRSEAAAAASEAANGVLRESEARAAAADARLGERHAAWRRLEIEMASEIAELRASWESCRHAVGEDKAATQACFTGRFLGVQPGEAS